MTIIDIMNGLAAVAVLYAMVQMQRTRNRVYQLESRMIELERKVDR